MCLLTQDIYPSIAEKDMECYKVVKYVSGAIMTPYMNLPLQPEIIEGRQLLCANDIKKVIFNETYSLNEVTCGYIHTFSSMAEAKQCILHENVEFNFPYLDITLVAFKCIIPKGTEYYVGYCENGTYYNVLYKDKKYMPLNSYASESIKFVREITDMELFGYKRKR